MSEEAVIDPPETFATAAIPLLREYLDKLSGIRTQVRNLKEIARDKPFGDDTTRIVVAELRIIQELLKHLRPAARQLGQQVSGMIDQGRLTPLERAELQLRLAEFETFLDELPQLITAYRFFV